MYISTPEAVNFAQFADLFKSSFCVREVSKKRVKLKEKVRLYI